MYPLVYAIMIGLCLLVAAAMGYLVFTVFSVERLRYIRGIALRTATVALLSASLLGASLTLLFLIGL